MPSNHWTGSWSGKNEFRKWLWDGHSLAGKTSLRYSLHQCEWPTCAQRHFKGLKDKESKAVTTAKQPLYVILVYNKNFKKVVQANIELYNNFIYCKKSTCDSCHAAI